MMGIEKLLSLIDGAEGCGLGQEAESADRQERVASELYVCVCECTRVFACLRYEGMSLCVCVCDSTCGKKSESEREEESTVLTLSRALADI